MIRSFKDSDAECIFNAMPSRRFSGGVYRSARRKLLLLDVADCIDDLRIPPGNRLEKLKGNRKGQYSIRVNERWRVCFLFSAGDARHVEIVDYH